MSYKITTARQAFLDTINWCEGLPKYDELFDYIPFDNNGPHPNVCVPFGDTCSTAAGRYQFLYSTWQDAISKLGIDDNMKAANQDQAALQRIDERGALTDIDTGNIESAINKCSYEWASMPPGRYGQPIKSLPDVLDYYDWRFEQLSQKKGFIMEGVVMIASIGIVVLLFWMLIAIFKALK